MRTKFCLASSHMGKHLLMHPVDQGSAAIGSPGRNSASIFTTTAALRVCVTFIGGRPQSVIVETKAPARALRRGGGEGDPDSHTLLVNRYIYRKLAYSLADFVPIVGLGVRTQALGAHRSVPAPAWSNWMLAKSKPVN